MFPKVSVMLVTYNHRKFIRESIESVLIQEYPNMEIVVADDASTDGNQEIIREYADQYPDLFKVILAEKNEGVTANCNRAFFACTGKYIAFFSGDDIMMPGKIKKQVEVLEKDETLSMCSVAMEDFNSKTNQTINIWKAPPNSARKDGTYTIEDILKIGRLEYGSIMARRSMCPAKGYDPRLPIAADFLFFLETSINGRIKALDEILYRHRFHGNNATFYKGVVTDLLNSLQILEEKYPNLIHFNYKFQFLFQYCRGLELLIEGNPEESKIFFRKSLFYNKKQLRSYLGLFISSSPRNIQRFCIKMIKLWKSLNNHYKL